MQVPVVIPNGTVHDYVVAFARAAADARGIHPTSLLRHLATTRVDDYPTLRNLIEQTVPKDGQKPLPKKLCCKQPGMYRPNRFQLMAGVNGCEWVCMSRRDGEPSRVNTRITLFLNVRPSLTISGSDQISVKRRVFAAQGKPAPAPWRDRDE